MTVTFGRLGRAFLLAAGASLALALVGLVVLDGTAEAVVSGSLGLIAAIMLVQGIVWIVLQRRLFGSVATLEKVATSGVPTSATIVSVRNTSSQIGADAIARLELSIDGEVVTRHVRVPFNYAAEIRPGRTLPVRTDPAGSRAMIVEWDRLS
jgi:hypothetical protein